jgi:hypothetical protein
MNIFPSHVPRIQIYKNPTFYSDRLSKCITKFVQKEVAISKVVNHLGRGREKVLL